MKAKHLLALALSAGSVSANAHCVGTDMYRTCTDQNGSQYNVHRYGNTTQVQGYNPNTGNTWSQTSNRVGNTTVTNGYDATGNAWNSTTTRHGGVTTTHGFDSDGNHFSRTCTAYGCH